MASVLLYLVCVKGYNERHSERCNRDSHGEARTPSASGVLQKRAEKMALYSVRKLHTIAPGTKREPPDDLAACHYKCVRPGLEALQRGQCRALDGACPKMVQRVQSGN